MKSENEKGSEDLAGKAQIIIDNFKEFLQEKSPFINERYTNILAGTIAGLSVGQFIRPKKRAISIIRIF